MVDEADGIDEAFEGQMRMLLMGASRLGERVARAREQQARNAQAASESEAREISARIAAERAAAQADLSKVRQDSWWESASLPQVADAYQTVVAWQGEGPFFASTKTFMEEQLESRYGIRPEDLPASGQEQDQARENGKDEHQEAAKERAEASALLAAADGVDRRAAGDSDGMRFEDEHPNETAEEQRLNGLVRDEAIAQGAPLTEAELTTAAMRLEESGELGNGPVSNETAEGWLRERSTERAQSNRETVPDGNYVAALASTSEDRQAAVKWDSSERREQLAQELDRSGIPEDAVAARLNADLAQGLPARTAVTTKAKTGAAKSPTNAGKTRDLHRGR
jgi:hypothetical protein